jgi:hypothetical protein
MSMRILRQSTQWREVIDREAPSIRGKQRVPSRMLSPITGRPQRRSALVEAMKRTVRLVSRSCKRSEAMPFSRCSASHRDMEVIHGIE